MSTGPYGSIHYLLCRSTLVVLGSYHQQWKGCQRPTQLFQQVEFRLVFRYIFSRYLQENRLYKVLDEWRGWYSLLVWFMDNWELLAWLFHISYKFKLFCSHNIVHHWLWRHVSNNFKWTTCGIRFHDLRHRLLLPDHGFLHRHHQNLRLKNGRRR